MTDKDLAGAVVELGKLALALGRVDRVTFHEDGTTPESDTDHSIMLGLIAPAFAARFLPKLDLGLVSQFATVHDLVEVYAGDTPTLRITAQEQMLKKEKERLAFHRIREEFGEILPWVPKTIAKYEAQIRPEARYVWAMDKMLPKITHILNGGATLSKDGIAAPELAERLARQTAEMVQRLDGEMDPMLELYAIMKGLLFETVYGEEP